LTSALAKYDEACRALAAAVSVDEVQDIRDLAEMQAAAARIAGNRDLEMQAVELRMRGTRRLGEIIAQQKVTVGLNRGRAGAGRPNLGGADAEQPKADERPTLAQAGITRKLSSQAQKLAALPPEKFESLVETWRGETQGAARMTTDLLKVGSEERGRIHRRDLSSALASASALTPSGMKYPASYSDPPWVRKAGIGNRAYENHYSTMSWPEILKYLERVGEAMQPDAWHWMWIPRAHLLAKVPYKTEVMLADGELVVATVDLPLAYACQLALGMDSYSTCYVWTKTDADHPDVSGMGLLVWDQDELLLQFKRGKGLPKPASDEKFGSNHRERPREHSRKPDHYRHMIATMVGKDSDGSPLPVLELFARVDAEHPLPENWDAWGNQAGVSLVAPQGAIETPTDAAPSPSSAGDADSMWPVSDLYDHPAIAGQHVVSMTLDHSSGASVSIATCQCGWNFCVSVSPEGYQRSDAEVKRHWRDVIALSKPDLPSPSGGETDAAAAEATDGASVAEAVADVHPLGTCVGCGEIEPCDDRCPNSSTHAPYDDTDVIAIDQLAGSEWLAPDVPFDPATLPEREALKILSDFCHPRRDIATALGEFYHPRGFAYCGVKEWSLTGKGWDRLRELEATEALPAARIELTAPRAQAVSLFDFARQIDQKPPAEVVDGALQTRLPVDADELAEQLALLAIDAGRVGGVEPDMIRHLIGSRGFVHCTTERVFVTDEGRAFLAQLVGPASVQQQGTQHG
jgi:N6-adenosine-specific RNA methylase IME4